MKIRGDNICVRSVEMSTLHTNRRRYVTNNEPGSTTLAFKKKQNAIIIISDYHNDQIPFLYLP